MAPFGSFRPFWSLSALLCFVFRLLLALSVAGMAYAYARGRTGELYLVGGLLILGVFAFEAFKGAEQLMVLPASVFE